MRGFFIGRDTKLLNPQQDCEGIRVWHICQEKAETGHMACCLEKSMYFIFVQRGEITCKINQDTEVLAAGEGVFINKNQAWCFEKSSGFSCILTELAPEYMEGLGKEASEVYVHPLMECMDFPYLKLTETTGRQKKILEKTVELARIAKEQELCWEAEQKGTVYELWAELYREFCALAPRLKKAYIRESQKLQGMLEFLQIHYREKITLAQMAEASGVSTGEYCRFFKKHMGRTPVEYLQIYRIEKTLPQILSREGSITQIAALHGFAGSSYYAETFKKEMGCAPGDYRKWYFRETDSEVLLKAKEAEILPEEPKAEPVPESVRRRAQKAMPAHLL